MTIEERNRLETALVRILGKIIDLNSRKFFKIEEIDKIEDELAPLLKTIDEFR